MRRTTPDDNRFLAVGISHATAPLDLLEQLYESPKPLDDLAQRIADADGLSASLILSTCNRLEIYVEAAPDTDPVPAPRRAHRRAHRRRRPGTGPLPVRAPRRRRPAPPLPGRLRPRLGRARRGPDPRPGQGGPRARPARRRGQQDPQPGRPGRAAHRQAGPQRDRTERGRPLPGHRGPGVLRAPGRIARREDRPGHRRRLVRRGRPGRAAPLRPEPGAHGQPHPARRPSASPRPPTAAATRCRTYPAC